MMNAISERRFTGWHMLAIMVAFFGTIISVNVLMAYYASASWSGMLSANTYVASQDFNKNAARAREWTREGLGGDLAVDAGVVNYRLRGPADILAEVDHVEAIFHRPVGEQQDFTIELRRGPDGYSAQHSLADGPWVVDLAVRRDDNLVFHEAERIVIGGK